jgi:hypothetical protein
MPRVPVPEVLQDAWLRQMAHDQTWMRAHSIKWVKERATVTMGGPIEGRRKRLVNPTRWPPDGSLSKPGWARCGLIAREVNEDRPQTVMDEACRDSSVGRAQV